MKRLVQSTRWAYALAICGIVVGAGLAIAPAIAPSPAAGAVTDRLPAARSDVNDFSFDSFSADYYLDRDEAGRSTLRTVETLVAVFPEFDQNRGILRALVSGYDGHPTDISIESVTDENGNARNYSSEENDGFLELTIADEGVYVHGRQSYVITYTQHNVTRYFADTNDDEFYWDANGTGWQQSFGTVTARVHLPSDLVAAATGRMSCYQGYGGSTEPCEITETVQPDGGSLIEASASELSGFQNLTFAIGFAPHTFTPRDDSAFTSVFYYLEALFVALASALGIRALVKRRTTFADEPGRPTIIAEYLPPKGVTLLIAAVVRKATNRAVAAQLISFAVRRLMRVIEIPGTSFLSSKPNYLIELVDGTQFESGERTLATAFFGSGLAPGSSYAVTRGDTVLGRKVLALIQSTKAAAVSEGFHKKIPGSARALPVLGVVVASAIAFALATVVMADARGGALPILTLFPAFVAFLIVISVVSRVPVTAKGAELRDYLKGLELYIKTAEADRFAMLQSPEGAERIARELGTTPEEVRTPGMILKLTERLLPFAVLFNQEKRWLQELGRMYGDNSPDWYSGSSTFNAMAFASGISSLTSTAATSYSGSSSSSSSGGSGGGGSSGGGGGGGGGGGV